MRVLVLFSGHPDALETVSREERWLVTSVSTLREAQDACRSATFDVFVCAAADLGSSRNAALRTFHTLVASLMPPVVLVATDDYRSLATVFWMAGRGARFEFALFRAGGRPEGIADAIALAVGASYSARVASEVLNRVGHPSPLTSDFVHDIMRNPHVYATGNSVLNRTGMTLQALNGQLRGVGLASFSRIRRGARVLHCYRLMCEHGYTARKAEIRMRYGSYDSFARDTRSIAGVPPGQLVSHVSPPDFIQLIAAYCLGEVRTRRPLNATAVRP